MQSVTHTLLWRRLDLPGHEWSQLHLPSTGPELSGTAVFLHDDMPCRLTYSIECDSAWITRSAEVSGSIGDIMVDVSVRRTRDGRWTINKSAVPDVTDAFDIDLAFSPATNVLPMRRLSLAQGEGSDVRAAWLTFPHFTLEPLDQRYTRLATHRWRYESSGGEFVRELTVDDEGMVIHYPGLWQREDSPIPRGSRE